MNVVPADVAAGRVASAEVQRERLLLEAQKAKRESEKALRDGDLSVPSRRCAPHIRAIRDVMSTGSVGVMNGATIVLGCWRAHQDGDASLFFTEAEISPRRARDVSVEQDISLSSITQPAGA